MALVGLAVTVVAVACSPANRRAIPTTTAVPASVASTTPTTEPAPQYAPSPYDWVRSTSAALSVGGGAGSTLSALLAPQLSGQWQMFGTVFDQAGTPAATAWSSANASTWSKAPLLPGEGPSQAYAAALYRGQTVVVGSVGTGANQQASVWLSPAAGTPFAAETVPLSDGPSTMTEVASGALGLFASGTVDGRFALWSSTDGRQWNEVSNAEKVIQASPGARVNALMALGTTIYAAGSTNPGPTEQAALWASGDGIHWHLVTTASSAFAGPGSRVIYSLAPLPTGLVAVGAINHGTGWLPASWISPDGASWSQPSTSFADLPVNPQSSAAFGAAGGAAARSVGAVTTLAGSTALVAAGGGPAGQAAWDSTDGLHWTSLDLPGPIASSPSWRAGVVGGTVNATVVVDSDAGQPHVMVDNTAGWSQPSADPAAFGPVRPYVVPLSLSSSPSVTDAANGAAGRENLTLQADVVSDPQSIGPAVITSEAFSSVDGANWVPAPTPPAPPGPPGSDISTQTSGAWVAIGEADSGHPEGWISPTGVAWTSVGSLDVADLQAQPSRVDGVCTAATAPAGAGTPNSSGTPTSSGTSTSSSTSTSTSTSTGTGPASSLPGTAVVAVGATIVSTPAGAVTGTVGRAAATWISSGGVGWKRGTVSPGPGPSNGAGAAETMSGCLFTSSGLVAYGASTSPTGAPEPAIWKSSDGTAWTRAAVSAFGADAPNPLVDLAVSGGDWLAVADPDSAADQGPGTSSPPVDPSTEAGPAAAAGTDAAISPATRLDGGLNGLWLSSDEGSTWQLLDTSLAPWVGTSQAEADLVAFTGRTPVVVGVVDGQLAAWAGTSAVVAANQ